MDEHTPGPWKNLNNEAVTSVENGHAVAFPSWHQHEWAANANLIAAAPDLLMALECFLIEYENWPDDENTCVDIGRAAIAKARGKDER